MTKTLKYVIYKDDKYYLSQCLNVDVSSFGTTPEDAVANLNEALELYFIDKEVINTITPVEEPQIGETKINV
jgi:predicted RNase H-like HicB family nuclease